MDDTIPPSEMLPEQRLSAVAAILACGFMRLRPTRLQRIRAAAEGSQSASYLLDEERDKSVYATVNQS